MTIPVSYVEIHSPDLAATLGFFERVFAWQAQPFAAGDYLVAPHGDAPGVDCGLTRSRDGTPRAVPVLRVPSLDAALAAITAQGGALVVEPFALPGVGRGCYCSDPAGALFGLHEYEADQA